MTTNDRFIESLDKTEFLDWLRKNGYAVIPPEGVKAEVKLLREWLKHRENLRVQRFTAKSG